MRREGMKVRESDSAVPVVVVICE